MPNWTYNRVYGSKKVIAALLDSDGNPTFENVVPIPDEIKILEDKYKLCSPHNEFDTYKKFYLEDSDELYKQFNSNEMLKNNTTFAEHINNLSSKYPVPMIELSNQAIDKYGCDDWYSWNNKYWGCKWNARSIGDPYPNTGVEEIEFETPWSPPEGVIKELARQFPKENWTWHSDEESCAFSVDFHPDGSGGYYEEDVDPEYYLPYIPETLEEFMDNFSGLTTRDDILEQVNITLPDMAERDINIDEKTHTIVVTVYNHEAYGGEKLFDAVFSNVEF